MAAEAELERAEEELMEAMHQVIRDIEEGVTVSERYDTNNVFPVEFLPCGRIFTVVLTRVPDAIATRLEKRGQITIAETTSGKFETKFRCYGGQPDDEPGKCLVYMVRRSGDI